MDSATTIKYFCVYKEMFDKVTTNSMHTLWTRGLSNFSQDGQTPLLLAVRKRNIAVVRELLGVEVNLNHMEKVRAYIPLFCTQYNRDGCTVYISVQGGLSALMLCCEEGNSEMAELLLDAQANPDLQQPVFLNVILSIANT